MDFDFSKKGKKEKKTYTVQFIANTSYYDFLTPYKFFLFLIAQFLRKTLIKNGTKWTRIKIKKQYVCRNA